jgi:hypothetical protein
MSTETVDPTTANENGENGADENGENGDAEGRQQRRPPYIESASPDLLNEDGKLVASPIDDYDPNKSCVPRKTDFADEVVYLQFKSALARREGEALIARADSLAEQANVLESAGTPEQRAAISRLSKLTATIASTREALEGDGVDVDALLKRLGLKSDD